MAKAKRVHSTPRRTTSSRKAPARKRARVAAPFPALDDWPEDAYYEFTIADRSMEPRHYEGCIAYVDPRWPLKEGHDVLFKIATPGGGAPKAYVKELVSIDDKTLRVLQFNPKRTISFPRKDVVLVHALWGAETRGGMRARLEQRSRQ